MNRDELLSELTQDVLAYVMQGAFPERELAQTIKPDGLDQRFNDYELLLDLHFILQDEVIEFVRTLPRQLRSVRTETETVSRTRRGTVDGHINWNATIKKRYSQNPNDNSLFVCENRSEDYDIPENLVLKKLISVIHTTLREADEYLRSDYQWVQETWKGNEELIDELKRIVDRNVHVRRIRDPETYEPTERMLTTAESSRQQLYRDAAACLRSREQLYAGDESAIRALLNETAITPDDDHALFELFVLFRFIATLEQLQDETFEFQTIARSRQELARIDGDKEIALYHDNSGSDRNLSFRTDAVPEDRQPTRSEQVQRVAREVAGSYFDKNFRSQTGRPDVIVLEIASEDPPEYEYLIAEVKHSTREQTIRTGIKETLEYLAFLRINEEFVFGNKEDAQTDYFGSGWNGLLVIQDLEQDTPSLQAQEKEDQEIKILQASELRGEDNELLSMLESLLYG